MLKFVKKHNQLKFFRKYYRLLKILSNTEVVTRNFIIIYGESKLQETLTSTSQIYKRYCLKRKSKFGIVKMLLTVIFCITIFVAFLYILSNYNFNYNKNEKYYLLSLNHTTSKRNLENLQTSAEEAVGVSYIYEKAGVYHVLGFIYDNEEDAKEVLDSVKDYFFNAQILVEVKNKLRTKVYRELRSNSKVYNIYKYECSLNDEILGLCKDVEKGVDVFEIYRKLTIMEVELDENFSYLSSLEKSSISEVLKLSHKVMLSFIRSCKDEIVIGGDLLENVKLLYMNVYFEENELQNSINQL